MMLQKECNPLELIQKRDVTKQEQNEDRADLLVSLASSLMENFFFLSWDLIKDSWNVLQGFALALCNFPFLYLLTLPYCQVFLTRLCWHNGA